VRSVCYKFCKDPFKFVVKVSYTRTGLAKASTYTVSHKHKNVVNSVDFFRNLNQSITAKTGCLIQQMTSSKCHTGQLFSRIVIKKNFIKIDQGVKQTCTIGNKAAP